jgi:hypothetical protein
MEDFEKITLIQIRAIFSYLGIVTEPIYNWSDVKCYIRRQSSYDLNIIKSLLGDMINFLTMIDTLHNIDHMQYNKAILNIKQVLLFNMNSFNEGIMFIENIESHIKNKSIIFLTPYVAGMLKHGYNTNLEKIIKLISTLIDFILLK